MSWDTGHAAVAAIAKRLEGAPGLEGCLVGESLRGLSRKQGLPLVTVLALREGAEKPVNRQTGAARVLSRIGVLIAVPVRNDPGGSKARASLQPLLDTTRAKLAGWCPEGVKEPIAWREGHLMDLTASHALWQDAYEFTWWSGAKQAGKATGTETGS
ncbi:phage tail terminator protein [Ruegeria atlantica]|uniref:phage tail terminator protein n=1 Tax=Ruegeria atlantica TaxID=81569 RepID=UPI00147E3F42|nr:hypothetical protein [Ruegeria atlantica]